MGKGITIAGNIIVDNIKYVDNLPKRGNLVQVKAIDHNVGGIVSNTLCQLRCLAPDMYLKAVGIIGSDENGKLSLDQLKKFDIDVSDVVIKEGIPTSFSDCMTEPSGQRTFFTHGGAGDLFNYDFMKGIDIPTDFLHMGYALLLKGMDDPDPEYGTVMAKTFKMLSERGHKTSMDVVSMENEHASEIVSAPTPFLTYFIINEVELSLGTGVTIRDGEGKIIEDNIREGCNKLFDMGVKEWVVIHCPEGAWAMNAKRHFWFVPSLKLPAGFIKSAVGAGDAFCAGTLLGLHEGWDIEETLKFASGAAACCLSTANTTDGMRDVKGTWDLIKEMEG